MNIFPITFFLISKVPWVYKNPTARAFLWSAEIITIQKCSFAEWKWTEYRSKLMECSGVVLPFEDTTVEHWISLFQATIDLVIGYDPPAGSTPNPNDPQDGNATVDAGIPGSSAAVVKALFLFFIVFYTLTLSSLFVLWWGGGGVGDESSPDGGQSGASGNPSSPSRPASLRQRLARGQNPHRLVNKPQDFQVGVHLHTRSAAAAARRFS